MCIHYLASTEHEWQKNESISWLTEEMNNINSDNYFIISLFKLIYNRN